MKKDSLSYNPNFQNHDSLSWFMKFIISQDEVPSNIHKKKDDTLIHNQIIQVKVEKPESYTKSLFTSHVINNSNVDAREKSSANPAWVSIIIALCFLLFAIARYGYYKRVQQIFKSFFTNNLFNQLSRDGGLFVDRAALLLFASYIIGLSLLIFKTYTFYYTVPESLSFGLLLFIEILACVIVFYLLKMGLFNLIGFIFGTTKETSDYVINIYIFCQIAGVALLPVIVLVTFIHSGIFIYVAFSMLSLLYLYRLYRGIAITLYNNKISVYYLFLYFCTLEILPLVVLLKIFKFL